MKTTFLILVVAIGALVMPALAQDTFKTDEEGFIRNWFVLAPIAIDGQSGADEIHHDFLNGEAAIKGCARFLRDDTPVTNVKISLTPQSAGVRPRRAPKPALDAILAAAPR